MQRLPANRISFFLALVGTVVLTACAEIRINTLPSPPATPKLRVYIQPHSTPYVGKSRWNVPDEKFAANQVRTAEKYLTATGIYEVVGKEDVQAVLGDRKPTSLEMERNDWALARKIGRALHADYVMVMERGMNPVLQTQYFLNVMINAESGKKFGARYSFTKSWSHDMVMMRKIIRASYRDLFRSAKEDLLATAVRKSERFVQLPAPAERQAPAPAQKEEERPLPSKEPEQPIVTAKQDEQPETVRESKPEAISPSLPPAMPKQEEPQAAEQPTQPVIALGKNAVEEKPIEGDWIKEYNAQKVLTQDAEQAKITGTRLVVYDLDSPQQYRPVALILSEALREELFNLRQFVLVNREDLEKVLQEMALQQTGLVDEKEAVKTGKGLAAGQVVTGRLGLLGKTFILQGKRIDVETFATLGLTSEKFKQGQEDEVLKKMPDLARRLAGMK